MAADSTLLVVWNWNEGDKGKSEEYLFADSEVLKNLPIQGSYGQATARMNLCQVVARLIG